MGDGLRTPQFLTCEQNAGESSVLAGSLLQGKEPSVCMHSIVG